MLLKKIDPSFRTLFLAISFIMMSSCQQENATNSSSSSLSVVSCPVYSKFYLENEETKKFYHTNILSAVEEGKLDAWTDHDFKEAWDIDEYVKQCSGVDSFYTPDPETNEPGWEVREKSFSWDLVIGIKYKACLMEDHSLRIEAIAPIVELISDGASLGDFPLFWVRKSDID